MSPAATPGVRGRLPLIVLLITASLAIGACSRSSDAPTAGGEGAVSTTSLDGGALYARNCQRCHGPSGTGSKVGPPLVHKIYEPSHHPDAAFYRAATTGVRAHHWHFGNMPQIGGASKDEVTLIIEYVRGLQRQAGIF